MLIFSAENILDESQGRARPSLQHHLDRLPAELNIVFETEVSVLFPTTVTAILAVKPFHGKVESQLFIPLQHQGDGRYQFDGTSDDLDEIYDWFVKHGADIDKGHVVIKQFDGLHASLRKLNGRIVPTNLQVRYAGKDFSEIINPDYSRYTPSDFDLFPYHAGRDYAPHVYARVPVEVLAAVKKETLAKFPPFAQQRVKDFLKATNLDSSQDDNGTRR